jgi:large subunit ribosomal protein L19
MQYFIYQNQNYSVGDTVALHQEIAEGNKKRIQVFEGIVIAISGRQAGKNIVLRKISSGSVAVEKIFPLNLPSIKKIILKRQGQVRRAKLYFLRQKVGRSATRIKEKNVGLKTQAGAKA